MLSAADPDFLKFFIIKKQTPLFIFLLLLSGITSAQFAWTQKQDAPVSRYEGVSFPAGDFVFYGLGHNSLLGLSDNKFYRFDPSSNTWDTIAAFPGVPRRLASAFSVGGKGYVCFGVDPTTTLQLNDLWEYDPALNVWNQKANLPANGWLAGTAAATTTKGYAGLGIHDHSSGYLNLEWWEYDPVVDQWNQKASMPGIGLNQTNSFTAGDSIYVVCGMGTNLIIPTREFWLYDIQQDTWTQLPDFPGNARTSVSAFSINGTGYAGYGLGSGAQDLFGDFYSYQPSSGIWTAESACATALFDASCATAIAGYVINNTSWNSGSPDEWEFGSAGTGISVTDGRTRDVTVVREKNLLRIHARSEASVSLFSPEGKILQRVKIPAGAETSIGLGGLASGIYYLAYESDKAFHCHKLICSE